MAGNFNKKRRQFLKHATLTPLLVNPSTSHAFFPLLARGLMMAFDFFVANAERRTVYEAVASTLARPAIVATVERAVISSTALTFAQRKTALQMIKAADLTMDVVEFLQRLEANEPQLAQTYWSHQNSIQAIWVKDNYKNHVVVTFDNPNDFFVKAHFSITVKDIESNAIEITRKYLLKATKMASGGFSISVANFDNKGLKEISFNVESDYIESPSSKTIFVV